ncbi:molybdopterin molybdotransferase MoeA [Desulfosporosinus burensis]
MLEFISLEEANRIIMKNYKLSEIDVVLLQHSRGRVLAENLIAKLNIPPFNRAAVDGYAVNSNDTGDRQFSIEGEIPAGHVYTRFVTSGKGIRIFTGAHVPPEITAVVRQEDVEVLGSNIMLKKPWSLGDNIALCGEDIHEGEQLLNQGTVITPACVGLLACQGFTKIPVFRRPKVGILSTGDELVIPGEPLGPGKIYNSNLYSIVALVEELGAEAVPLRIVTDSIDTISATLDKALEQVDLVITTGGASVGDYDVITDAITHIGGKLLFWRVAIKPGTPIIAGNCKNKLVIGLSGNPAAALIGAELLVAPLLRKMLGHTNTNLKIVNAVASGEVHKACGIRRMIRVRVEETSSGRIAILALKQKSGILKSLAECNGVLDLGPNELVKDGEQHKVILF